MLVSSKLTGRVSLKLIQRGQGRRPVSAGLGIQHRGPLVPRLSIQQMSIYSTLYLFNSCLSIQLSIYSKVVDRFNCLSIQKLSIYLSTYSTVVYLFNSVWGVQGSRPVSASLGIQHRGPLAL